MNADRSCLSCRQAASESGPVHPPRVSHPAPRDRTSRKTALIQGILFSSLVLVAGCGPGPSRANIELRQQNQQLRDEIAELQRQRAADAATITALQRNATTVPSLPQERLEKLFTVAGIQLGRLTGGFDTDPSLPGDEAIRVQVVPTDQDGQPIKAAGSFVVQAFDLAAANPRVGEWRFDVDQAKSAWRGDALLYHYILTCPLKSPVEHSSITLKVQFTDELTGRQFEQQRVITVRPR